MANIAIFRINYKSDFILTLNSDAGWMTPFCIKFWTGAPSQAYFVGFNGTTYTHCAPVDGEPTKLRVQFDDHHLPIGDLKFQIGYHFTVADFPTSMEDEVLNQASIVIEVDDAPAQVMLDLNGETAPEIEFSLPAYANEAQRIANEEARIAAEQQRIANEDARIQAEETRQQNEQQRIDHETARVNEFATLKSQSQAATRDANDAATLANQKAQLAADKAALADDAATLANQKAQLAADKAALANDAAQLAADKAALAQQKAEYAQQQGSYAKNQGDYAKNQGNYAKEQGDYAKEQGDYAKEQGDYAKQKGDDAVTQMQQQAQAFDQAQAARQTAYEQAEGTESGSVAGDGSRWGAFKTNEAARDAKVDAKVADITNLQKAVAEGAVYDISANHLTEGLPTKYANLSAALGANGANVPVDKRKGGMSVKYIQSSDNKYVQYRYMGTAVTGTPNPFLDVLNWQENTEEYINNPKYLYIIKDGSDKLLFAIDIECNVVFGNGCPKQIKKLIQPIIDFFSETEEDIKERLELTLDQNNNLLSWRDKDGTKHEALFAAGKFVFSDANKRQLVNALKDVNYGNQTDWSDASSIAIPIPRCARINVTNISSMPVAKNTNARAVIQFWDMQGNTFTKTATLNAQGQHSMGDPKKNISIDLHDHNWDGDFSIKFGDWVPQSSFHIKSYWLDWSRVVGPVSYDVIEQVDKSRGILKDRSWKRALMTSSVTASSDLDVRMDTGAKCHPMGFPCIVYLNSEFYGIFIWQLKKHRDNYHMEKDNPNHIHVEGLQLSKGDFSWTLNEIRNPKYLVYAEPHSGTYEYDGDVAVAEIAGEKDGTVASAYSDSTTYTKGALCLLNGRMFMSLADNNTGNTPVACTKPKNVFKNATDYWIDVTFTNTVKQTILRAANYQSEISAAATTEAKKALIEQYYDMDNVIDIALEIAAMRDSDYVGNIQSTTWDGVKWYLNAYDKDRSLGLGFVQHTDPPSTGSLPVTGAFDYIHLYKTEAKERWNELVEKGIFTLENISGILNDWMLRIGYENYKLEDAKWPPSGDYTYDTVERLYNYIEQNLRVQNEYMNNL